MLDWILTFVLVIVTAVAVRQARMISRLRREGLEHPADEIAVARVRLTARRDAALRTTIGILTLLLAGLGSVIVS